MNREHVKIPGAVRSIMLNRGWIDNTFRRVTAGTSGVNNQMNDRYIAFNCLRSAEFAVTLLLPTGPLAPNWMTVCSVVWSTCVFPSTTSQNVKPYHHQGWISKHFNAMQFYIRLFLRRVNMSFSAFHISASCGFGLAIQIELHKISRETS